MFDHVTCKDSLIDRLGHYTGMVSMAMGIIIIGFTYFL